MSNALSLAIDADALTPLIVQIVNATLARALDDREKSTGKLCYSEAEAAALLGVGPHVLRDERQRGRIVASKIAGRRIRYTDADLRNYLASRRTDTAA